MGATSVLVGCECPCLRFFLQCILCAIGSDSTPLGGSRCNCYRTDCEQEQYRAGIDRCSTLLGTCPLVEPALLQHFWCERNASGTPRRSEDAENAASGAGWRASGGPIVTNRCMENRPQPTFTQLRDLSADFPPDECGTASSSVDPVWGTRSTA